jgi:O-antigen/teichoic acid export membrane protein
MAESLSPAPIQSLNLRQLASNYTLLSGGEVLSKILSFAAFSLLARILMPANFGYLEFTLALMLFLSAIVDFGTAPYGARELAKKSKGISELVTNVSALRLLLAVLAYLLLTAFVFFAPGLDLRLQRLIFIYGLTLFGIPFFIQWVFQGLDQMKWVALGSVVRQMIFAVGVFLLIRRSDQLLTVGWIECAAVAGFVLYQISVLLSRMGPLQFQFNPNFMKNCFREAMPIGLSELTWISTWYLPTILLGLTVGGEAVGWFSAALRPIMTLHTFVWLYFYNLFPSLSRHAQQPKQTEHHLVDHSLAITAWSAVFLGLAGGILARPIITLIFGQRYLASVPAFRILVWMLSITLLSGHYRYLLIAFNQQRYEFLSSLCAAIVSLVLSIFFIPRFSYQGAAVAIVVAAAVNWAMAFQLVHLKIGRIPAAVHLIKPLVAGGIMLTIFFALDSWNHWLAVAASMISFGLAFLILGPRIRKTLGGN